MAFVKDQLVQDAFYDGEPWETYAKRLCLIFPREMSWISRT